MPEPGVPAPLRRLVSQRARGCCEYCFGQAKFALQEFSVEHILPKSKGGTSESENLALACQGCNNHKYNHTHAPDPVSGAIVPIYHPRRQRWSDHFAWNEDFTVIVGLTQSGRATVQALQLNRLPLMNLRKVLYQAGEHPPATV
jgi:5-methylcytosine-specific restriction endonuclease McrA